MQAQTLKNGPASRERSGPGHGGLSSMPRKTLEERFWGKVDRSGGPNACWEWQASTRPKGYGSFRIPGIGTTAHRVAYQLTYGRLKEPGLVIHHLCENPPCCNPAHLVPTTNRHNILIGRSFSAVNAAKTHCIHGHEFTEENTYYPPHRPGGRECRICRRRLGANQRKRNRSKQASLNLDTPEEER